jgi:hypothetical protein
MPASAAGAVPLWQDSALYVALALAAFTILFGTRHLDATERHEGMVAAIAFESVVKLLAFLAVGVFVTWGCTTASATVFARAPVPDWRAACLRRRSAGRPTAAWFALTLLSMLSVIFLPRQFQVDGGRERRRAHLRRAVWVFPLYLLLINLFVLPIALGGLLHFGRHGRRRHLRADPAAGPPAGGAGAAGLHRRAVGGHRHGHRRNHRGVDHGLQRPGDAAAAALRRWAGQAAT